MSSQRPIWHPASRTRRGSYFNWSPIGSSGRFSLLPFLHSPSPLPVDVRPFLRLHFFFSSSFYPVFSSLPLPAISFQYLLICFTGVFLLFFFRFLSVLSRRPFCFSSFTVLTFLRGGVSFTRDSCMSGLYVQKFGSLCFSGICVPLHRKPDCPLVQSLSRT